MKTGSFFTTVGLPGRVSIARWAPKGFKELPRCGALAPGTWFKSVDEKTYRKLYAEQLSILNPGAIWEELHLLAGGYEPILLCWERPGEFCHRQLVARWLGRDMRKRIGELIE